MKNVCFSKSKVTLFAPQGYLLPLRGLVRSALWRAMLAGALALFAGSLSAAAAEIQKKSSEESGETATYGELMLIEQKASPAKSWQVEASGMQEFSNPYLDISGASASVKKSIGAFFYIGPEFTRYFAKDSSISKNVAQALKTDTIEQTVYRPKSSVYGVASVIPVAGHLNLFNTGSLPFELEFSVGYGSVQYEKKPSVGALLWRVGPRAFLTNALGLQFQFGQEIEAPFQSQKVTKSHGRLGFVLRF